MDALDCLSMYRKQVTHLDLDQRRELIDIITKGRFLRSRGARKYPESHGLYRSIRDKKFAAEHLSWPEYIILRALYREGLPQEYIGHIERKFGTAIVENFSDAFFKLYPQAGHEFATMVEFLGGEKAAKLGDLMLAPVADFALREQGDINKWFDDQKAIKDKRNAEDDELSVPKRQKTSQAPDTQNTPSTAQQTPNAITAGQASENTQGEDNAASVAPERSQADEYESRLKALEESQKGLMSKLDATTAALDAMNTTIEKIAMDASTD